MSKALAGLDRFLVLLVGVLLVVGGVWALAWATGVPLAHELAGRISLAKIDAFVHSTWYPIATLLSALVAGVAGVWLIVANLRRHSFNKIASQNSSDDGLITVATLQVAKAAGEQLTQHPDIVSVDTSTRIDRGRPTITWTVHAVPDVQLQQVVDLISLTESDIREALPGVDADTRFLLHLQPVPTT